MKDCWAYQPEARPSWRSLVTSLHKMYNAALPGEYLDVSVPTLPTPPSSTETSAEQFLPTNNQQLHTNDRTDKKLKSFDTEPNTRTNSISTTYIQEVSQAYDTNKNYVKVESEISYDTPPRRSRVRTLSSVGSYKVCNRCGHEEGEDEVFYAETGEHL